MALTFTSAPNRTPGNWLISCKRWFQFVSNTPRNWYRKTPAATFTTTNTLLVWKWCPFARTMWSVCLKRWLMLWEELGKFVWCRRWQIWFISWIPIPVNVSIIIGDLVDVLKLIFIPNSFSIRNFKITDFLVFDSNFLFVFQLLKSIRAPISKAHLTVWFCPDNWPNTPLWTSKSFRTEIEEPLLDRELFLKR